MENKKDYLHMSLVDMHNALVNKEITPFELVSLSLSAIKKDKNNAYEIILEESALEEAKKLSEVEIDNLFWGIPYVLKDNFSTEGILTTGSSNILNGYVPVYSATVYKKLKEKHAILVAKATLDELAMGGTGTTGHKGKTYNPYDKSHTHQVGGSSCGSAVAVSSGVVPFALGSDTGDSVRKPASYAGLVGFKPSWGRISRFGLFPFAPSLDHVAYFTRNVYDSALLLSLLAGRDMNDSTSSNKEVIDYSIKINDDVSSYKVAVIKEIIDSIDDSDIKNAFFNSINNLKSLGVTVEMVSFDINLLKAIYPSYIVISCAEATSNNANLDGIKFGPRYQGNTYEEVMEKARTNGFSELIRRRFVIGSYSLLKENQNELFLRAQKCRRLIVNEVNRILSTYDFIYLPASPTTAPTFASSSDKLSNEYLIADNHLALANFAGLPSITLPIGMKDGLPFGANFTSRAFEEDKVLNIAHALEATLPYKNMYAKEDE
ncbi:MAG: amidase family protein [Bacilli bacterium]